MKRLGVVVVDVLRSTWTARAERIRALVAVSRPALGTLGTSAHKRATNIEEGNVSKDIPKIRDREAVRDGVG